MVKKWLHKQHVADIHRKIGKLHVVFLPGISIGCSSFEREFLVLEKSLKECYTIPHEAKRE